MKQLKYTGAHPVSVMFINGGGKGNIHSGDKFFVPDEDFTSVMDWQERAKEPNFNFKEVTNNG